MILDKEAEVRKKSNLRSSKNENEIPRYRADITAGSLKIFESRKIAEMLFDDLDEKKWKKALTADNILKSRTPATAIRFARLIRQRLEMFDQELWLMISEGSNKLATEACFIATLKQSPLVGDFLLFVLKEKDKVGSYNFNSLMWDQYIDECRDREPDTPIWSESTVKRLKSSTLQILKQAGCIKSSKELKIAKIHFEPQIISYLKKRNERYVLKCLEAVS